MRAIISILCLSTACAHSSGPHYVNVAAIRHQIDDAITVDPVPRRSIVSMGHVTDDVAVVYTQGSSAEPRREETWVRVGKSWRREATKDVATTGTIPPTAN